MLFRMALSTSSFFDCKIVDTLLKKGTKKYVDGWDAHSKTWAHMVLHLPYADTSSVWFSLNRSKAGLAWLSLKRKIYVLRLI